MLLEGSDLTLLLSVSPGTEHTPGEHWARETFVHILPKKLHLPGKIREKPDLLTSESLCLGLDDHPN